MKNLIPLFLLLLASCTSAIKDQKAEKENPENFEVIEAAEEYRPKPTENLNVKNKEDLIGYWVGWFVPDVPDSLRRWIYTGESSPWNYSNKINVSIDSFYKNKVFGHSVVANNYQTFSGTVSFTNGVYSFSVKEPGNDKHDGAFKFSIEENDSIISGKWKSFEELETSRRIYTLHKRNFKYDPNFQLGEMFIDWDKFKKPEFGLNDDLPLIDMSIALTKSYIASAIIDLDTNDINSDNIDSFIKEVKEIEAFDEVYYRKYFTTSQGIRELNASSQILTQAQVENLTKADIYVLRNSIYARHGYSFRKRQLRAYFDKQDWYIPVHANIKSDLTEIEKKNIQLLLKYEEHAEEYYDEFGRG